MWYKTFVRQLENMEWLETHSVFFFSSLQTFFSLKLNGHNPIMFRSCCKTNKKHLMSLWVCMLKLSKAGVISFKKLYCVWGWEKKMKLWCLLREVCFKPQFYPFLWFCQPWLTAACQMSFCSWKSFFRAGFGIICCSVRLWGGVMQRRGRKEILPCWKILSGFFLLKISKFSPV